MSDFVSFCRAHGVVIDTLPPIGVWKRLKTTDKPSHRNGAVKYLGTHGFVQNHATMQSVATWRNVSDSPIAHQQVQRIAQKAAREIADMQAKAAQKATWILGQCKTSTHAYIAAKGFPDELVNVWEREDGPILVIPMRINQRIVGCQMVTERGDKRFLFGQRTGNAEFIFANRGPHILCEGYATGISIRHALRNLKRPYTLHVCFSAGNMVKVASTLPRGFIVADNDASGAGERVAREIGWPCWMSEVVGQDANDYFLSKGMFALAQHLSALMLRKVERVP